EEKILDDKLTCDPETPGPERDPRDELANPTRCSHQQQVRHVDDPDQKHKKGAAPEPVERRLDVADEVVLHTHDVRTKARIDQELTVLRKAIEISGVQ